MRSFFAAISALKKTSKNPANHSIPRLSNSALLHANGIDLIDIKEWLGHSDISTHFEFTSKAESAEAIIGVFPDLSA